MARSNAQEVEVVVEAMPEDAWGDENPMIEFDMPNGEKVGMLLKQYPISSVVAYFVRGSKHAFQNEVASSAGKEVEAILGITKATPPKDKEAMLEDFREGTTDPATADKWIELKQAQFDKRWNALINGEIEAGSRVARDEVEKKYVDLLDKGIKAKLKPEKDPEGNPIKLPTNDKDVITFANGMQRTRPQMRANFAASLSDRENPNSPTWGEVLRTEAEEQVAREKAMVKPAAPVAANDPTALGL